VAPAAQLQICGRHASRGRCRLTTWLIDLPVVLAVETTWASVAYWIVGIGVIGGLAGSSVRVVPEHERIVITRLGRIVGVRGPGLTLRLVGLERLTTVSLRPVQLKLTVSAVSRDGMRVHLLAQAQCRITDAAQSMAASPSPGDAAAAASENWLAKEIAHTELDALLATRARFESQAPPAITTAMEVFGVAIDDLQVTDIEGPLGRSLAHWSAPAGFGSLSWQVTR
jgi:regulator of protease activity HflC (stomatin/prohibitin superfamily)